jgi:hypothetical protein
MASNETTPKKRQPRCNANSSGKDVEGPMIQYLTEGSSSRKTPSKRKTSPKKIQSPASSNGSIIPFLLSESSPSKNCQTEQVATYDSSSSNDDTDVSDSDNAVAKIGIHIKFTNRLYCNIISFYIFIILLWFWQSWLFNL